MRSPLGFLSTPGCMILRFQIHLVRGSIRVLGGKKDRNVLLLEVLSSLMGTSHLGPYQLAIKPGKKTQGGET